MIPGFEPGESIAEAKGDTPCVRTQIICQSHYNLAVMGGCFQWERLQARMRLYDPVRIRHRS